MLDDPKAAAEAFVLRCGFNIGFFDKIDIEKWAESQIAATDEPSIELIDLAILRDKHPYDVMKLLASVGDEIPVAEAIAAQIGLVGSQFENGPIPLVSAVRGLYTLVLEPGVSDAERQMIYHLDDGYDCALNGYVSMTDLEAELRTFIQPYVERLQTIIDLKKLKSSDSA
jgi:hypothetical protein